jgi:hypothetical protein
MTEIETASLNAHGLLRADVDDVASAFVTWMAQLGRSPNESVVAWTDQRSALADLQPLGPSGPTKQAFIPHREGWTLCINNTPLGNDPFSLVSYLAETAGWSGLLARYSEDSRQPLRYGVSSFALFGPRPTLWLNEIRTVSCLNDGGRWKFFARGDPLPFEQPDYYLKRRIKDRLPLEVLRSYCLAVEADPWDSARSTWSAGRLFKLPV